MRKKLPNRRQRIPIEFDHWGSKFVGGAGLYPGGEVGEIFLTAGKTGTNLQVSTAESAVAVSLALQFGADIDTIRKAMLRNEDGTAAGPIGKMLDILAGDGGDGDGC